MGDTAKRFFHKVRFVDKWFGGTRCLEWTGLKTKEGYGRFIINQKQIAAHRWSLSLCEDLDADLSVDHLCRNTSCVNPSHLEQVPIGVNIRRGSTATKTHCKHGHPFDDENTRWRNSGKHRQCRKCCQIKNQQNAEKYNEARRTKKEKV